MFETMNFIHDYRQPFDFVQIILRNENESKTRIRVYNTSSRQKCITGAKRTINVNRLLGTGQNKFVRRGPTFSGVGGWGGYRRHQLSYEHYRQHFIGFKILVGTEIFS